MSSELKGDPETLIKLTKGLMKDKVEAESIPSDLVTDIEKVLEAAKNKAILEGKVEKVREIHHAKYLLDSRVKRPVTTRGIRPSQQKSLFILRNKPRKTHCESEIVTKPQMSDLESMLSEIQENSTIKPEETNSLPDLVDYTRDKTMNLADAGKLNEAQDVKDAHEFADLLRQKKEQIAKRAETKNQIEEMVQQREESIIRTKDEHKEFMEKSAESVESLIQKENEEFEKEMIEFDKVTNGEIPAYHKRFSPELLNLRQQESYLISSKRYAEAATVRQMADKKEEGELIKIVMNWKQYRANIKKKLTLEHKKRLMVIEGRCDIKKSKKEQRTAIKIDTTENAMRVLKKQIDEIDEGSRIIESSTIRKKPVVTARSKSSTPREKPLPKSSIERWTTSKNPIIKL